MEGILYLHQEQERRRREEEHRRRVGGFRGERGWRPQGQTEGQPEGREDVGVGERRVKHRQPQNCRNLDN